MTATAPTLRIGEKSYPVVLPRLGDPRLHLAAVIISIHVLGQVALGFRVSVPQIVAAILTCAVIEVVVTFRQSAQLVWPASAMLTGSGVALILRLVGAERGDHWAWNGWPIFALVAGFSLLTKYVIRYRATHVFNPSNVGLVVAFLVLGSSRVEPLDFWWSPLDGWMAAAYLIIIVGGVVITARLKLLAMAVTFWVALAAGIGLVAASGHCMTAAWSLDPVCGVDFWRIVATSPEVLIFLFFMITDPKTIPRGRLARILFAIGIALVSTLLMAPQVTEFGAKVGLLAGLVVLSPLRGPFDRVFGPGPSIEAAGLWARLTASGGGRPFGVFARGAAMGSLAVLVAVAIVAAGGPGRDVAQAAVAAPLRAATVAIDLATLPAVTVDEGVRALNSDIGAAEADQLAVTLSENLAIEGEAVLASDPSILRAVDHGARLIEMERRIEGDAVAKRRVVWRYAFDSLHLRAVFGASSQSGPSLGFDATGTVDLVTHDEDGAATATTRVPFTSTFVLNQATGDRWLIVEEQEMP